MSDQIHPDSKPLRLIYIVGRYPELTDTFIDREIATLRQFGDFHIQTVSIRYPLTLGSSSTDHQKICQDTLYLIPQRWSQFNYAAFLLANLFFIFTRPKVYFGTFFYLFTHPHPSLKTRLMTILHFLQGVYAAFLLRDQKFDHIHAHFIDRAVIVALVVSRFLDKSYSLTAHAADIYTKAILLREKIANASFVVTVSQYNKAYLLKTYPGLDPEKFHVIHPWVDVVQFSPPPDPVVHDRLHILSVGRLVEKKGHLDLVDACRLLRDRGLDFECRIVGEGPLRSELEERITRYHLQGCVDLLGGQPQEKVRGFLGAWTDVFVLPCVIANNGDRDGIPVSLAEAMAIGLPVISTDIVGIGELVQPGTGILVPPHHPMELAAALQTLSSTSPMDRMEIGRMGRAVVTGEFNLLDETRRLAHLFRKTIDECASHREEGIWPVSR